MPFFDVQKESNFSVNSVRTFPDSLLTRRPARLYAAPLIFYPLTVFTIPPGAYNTAG